MQKSIKIEYRDGEEATYTAYPPDFVRWEKASGKTISQFSGMWDILFITHSAGKRDQLIKEPFEVWMEKVVKVDMAEDNPKATSAEV